MSELRSTRRRLAVLLALLLPLATGCHAYRAVPAAEPDPGSSVRVRLADSTARARAGWTGTGADELVGRVVRRSADSLVLSVPARLGPVGTRSGYGGTVAVPSELIVGVEREELSLWRSVLLGVGVVGGTLLLLELNDAESTGGSPPSPDGNPPELRIPWP